MVRGSPGTRGIRAREVVGWFARGWEFGGAARAIWVGLVVVRVSSEVISRQVSELARWRARVDRNGSAGPPGGMPWQRRFVIAGGMMKLPA